jgi:hypothetical protein
MGLFKGSKSLPYSESHLKKSDFLIHAAHIYALGTYLPLINEYPEIEAVANSQLLVFWEYLITVASVGTAFAEIADTVPRKDQRRISHAIKKKLDDWQPGTYDVLLDFIKALVKFTNDGIEIPDAIGGWVWLNLEKHEQADQKLKELASSGKLIRVTGLPILITFHNWWVKK